MMSHSRSRIRNKQFNSLLESFKIMMLMRSANLLAYLRCAAASELALWKVRNCL
jgi:hypothetical protein